MSERDAEGLAAALPAQVEGAEERQAKHKHREREREREERGAGRKEAGREKVDLPVAQLLATHSHSITCSDLKVQFHKEES